MRTISALRIYQIGTEWLSRTEENCSPRILSMMAVLTVLSNPNTNADELGSRSMHECAEIKGQRGREAERQRGREAERQRGREAERQRGREAERRR